MTVFFGREVVAYSLGLRAGTCRTKLSQPKTPPLHHCRIQDGVLHRTYTWEFDAAITTFWRCSLLLDVEVSKLATWSLDHSDLITSCVVWITSSLQQYAS